MGGCLKRLAHIVTLTVVAQNNFVFLQSLIANELKLKAHLKTKTKWQCIAMCFCDFIKMEIRLSKGTFQLS